MSIVKTSITNLQWKDVKIDFSGEYPKVYYKDKEIKKVVSLSLNRCEVVIEHALLEDTYDILNKE